MVNVGVQRCLFCGLLIVFIFPISFCIPITPLPHPPHVRVEPILAGPCIHILSTTFIAPSGHSWRCLALCRSTTHWLVDISGRTPCWWISNIGGRTPSLLRCWWWLWHWCTVNRNITLPRLVRSNFLHILLELVKPSSIWARPLIDGFGSFTHSREVL